jgi:hypothetical protein
MGTKKRQSEAVGKVNFSTSYSQYITNNFLEILGLACHKTVTLSLTTVKAPVPQYGTKQN